jgi:CRISPR-associated protein Csx17
MSERVVLGGLRADTLGGYLGALGLLRVLARQRAPETRLSWRDDLPVLTGVPGAEAESGIDALAEWLVDAYRPSPVVSPWNAGSGFAGTGKSPEAERVLARVEGSPEPRFAVLRAAVAAGREAVVRGRAAGWAGETLWAKQHKATVIQLCRNLFPDEAQWWVDVAAVLGTGGVSFNPLAGTGGNFGRQDLSVTFLQSLTLVIGEDADRPASLAWARAALGGDETVPYRKGPVGQFDPGRTGFANPWRVVLTVEGLLLFASAAVRRYPAAPTGAAWPFTVHAAPVGHPTACAGENAKGEVWAPLWSAPAGLAEVEHLFGEGRAQWGGAQAGDGLRFALAVAALGVDRNLAGFRRFAIVERLGQSPIAVPAGRVSVARRDEQALLAEPYQWLSALRRKDRLPATVAIALRQTEEAVYDVATGRDRGALARFVTAFGRLHEAVGRSGQLRDEVRPYRSRRPTRWAGPPSAVLSSPEWELALGFASLRDRTGDAVPALRPLLTRAALVPRDRGASLVWADGPVGGVELHGATLVDALARAHVLRVRTGVERSPDRRRPRTAFPIGRLVSVPTLTRFLTGHGRELDSELLADLLRGLLVLDWQVPRRAAPGQPAAPQVALEILLPFFGTTPVRLKSTWRDDLPHFTADLRPRPDWVARLAASSTAEVLDDALLRLQLAGCHPLVRRPDPGPRDEGPRLAAALLARVALADRVTALRAVAAVSRVADPAASERPRAHSS